MGTMQKITNEGVVDVFEAYPEEIRARLLQLRQVILDVAAEYPAIGEIEETLKWGQISYLPVKSRIGTTIRIDQLKDTEQYAMYVPCSTTLLDTYRSRFADIFEFEGDRAIILNLREELPMDALKDCIAMALTYHLGK